MYGNLQKNTKGETDMKLPLVSITVAIVVSYFVGKIAQYITLTLIEHAGITLSLTCFILLIVVNSEVVSDEL